MKDRLPQFIAGMGVPLRFGFGLPSWNMGDTRIMDLPDGRELAWLELGDLKDPAVFVFHGTPGSRLQVAFDDGAINAARVRFIAVDRPGYGHSTFQRVRRLADWASDVSCLADHLHVEGFSVVGISGGGPHAAACARFLPDRVRAAGIVSGVGPLADPRSEEEMMIFNRLVTRLARKSHYLAYPIFALSASLFRRWPERSMHATSGQLPPSDIEIMGRPEVKSAYIDSYRRAPSSSALAAAQDFSLFARPWGFRLEDIKPPVHLWHGDDDRNVPISHGWLQAERIPGAFMHDCPGEGHLLALERLEEILRTVSAEGTRAPGSCP
jgi:pimeloyl-ACP methyl ester carboxylesterase